MSVFLILAFLFCMSSTFGWVPEVFYRNLFFGVFLVDIANSMAIVDKMKRFAAENEIVLKYEAIKDMTSADIIRKPA